jgi:hypothetical protein
MRHRWEVNWDSLNGLAAVWFVAGFVAIMVCLTIWRNHDRHGQGAGAAWVHSPAHWVLPLWLGPFAVAASVLGVYGAMLGLRELWRHPPIRRVTEPVRQDLRHAEKR